MKFLHSARESKLTDFWATAFYYDSGGSALISALKRLSIEPYSKILIPSYLCKSIPNLLRNEGFKPIFVDPKLDLTFNSEAITHLMSDEQIEVVLLVDYFGFMSEHNLKFAKAIKQTGTKIIIDRCHSSLFQKNQKNNFKHVDAIIYSFRKTFNVSDGGALILKNSSNTEHIKQKPLYTEYKFLLLKIMEFFVSRLGWPNIYSKNFTYLKNIKKSFTKQRNIKSSNHLERTSISFSLFNHIKDLNKLNRISSVRLKNFDRLKIIFKSLDFQIIFEKQDKESIPQVLVVHNENKKLVEFLNNKGIGAYCWPGDDLDEQIKINPDLFPNTLHLNDTLACIPIHQGIDSVSINLVKVALTEFRDKNETYQK